MLPTLRAPMFSSLGLHISLTVALLVIFPTLIFILFKLYPYAQKTLSSFAIAAFFLRHGPNGFLLLREKLGKGEETFRIGKYNLVVFNLDIIKHCLVQKAHNYDKGGRAARLMGEVVGPLGILGALDEDDHVPSHQVLNPHTKRADRIETFESMVLEEGERKLDEWRSLTTGARKTEVNLYIDLNEIFFRVLYRFMFGIDLSRKRFQHVHGIISQLERYSAVVGFVPAKLLPVYKLLRRDVASLVVALNKEVESIIEEGAEDSPLHELKEPSAGVSPVQLRDTVKNLLFAGATTAANALGWAVHCVSKEAIWAKRASEAARQGNITFFKNVCQEANRVYPQANVVTRRAKEDDYVPGYGPIAKGSILVIPIIALHRHPRYYPEAPHAFNPDRWLDQRPPPLMSYIPFTAGPRQCIGQSLFNRAGPPLLMRLHGSFDFYPLEAEPKPKWPNAVLPPRSGGFRMIITPSSL